MLSEIQKSILSEYNKGYTGFKKYGEATGYIARINEAIKFIREL